MHNAVKYTCACMSPVFKFNNSMKTILLLAFRKCGSPQQMLTPEFGCWKRVPGSLVIQNPSCSPCQFCWGLFSILRVNVKYRKDEILIPLILY